MSSELVLSALKEAAASGCQTATSEHLVLAIFDEASIGAEILHEAGTDRALVENLTRRRGAKEQPDAESPSSVSMAGDAERVIGIARGLALAWGEAFDTRHVLLGLVYDRRATATWSSTVGMKPDAIVAAMSKRGLRVPEVAPSSERKPWRGAKALNIPEEYSVEFGRLLQERYPPGSDLRWGVSWLAGPPRVLRVVAEEGIDLQALYAEAH